ncbi:MAG: BMC domain-containing protein [bacterium]
MNQSPSLGMVETSNVVRGIEAADAMLKAAPVELVLNRTICSGKYIVLVRGEVGGVLSSVAAGVERAADSVVDQMVLPHVHPAIVPALGNVCTPGKLDALGIVETFSIATLLEAADGAAKTSAIDFLELRLAMALGGKAFVTFTGTVASVQAAVDAAAGIARDKGMLVAATVIARPRPEIVQDLI